MVDNICVIISFEGYYINGHYFVREFGYADGCTAGVVRFAFDEETVVEKDWKTVDYCEKHLNGLSLYAAENELVEPRKHLNKWILDIYKRFKTKDRYVVGFKGGHVEKDILKKLNIPYLNLEELGCPRFPLLLKSYAEFECRIPHCGFHKAEYCAFKKYYCAKVKCFVYWKWLQKHCHLFSFYSSDEDDSDLDM